MNNFMRFLNITFSKECLDQASVHHVSLDEMVLCLTEGRITRLNDGGLSFILNGIQVKTCSTALIAMSVLRHSQDRSNVLYKSEDMLSGYELAMVA
ncbi:MAG: hypothetical protein BM556_12115 [Bacteriovorax sp. MedPE-SWde]|nr:MAG: hypothetical protein BM556_12115 [Bacteriovorax sp. MedPE-SWde]